MGSFLPKRGQPGFDQAISYCEKMLLSTNPILEVVRTFDENNLKVVKVGMQGENWILVWIVSLMGLVGTMRKKPVDLVLLFWLNLKQNGQILVFGRRDLTIKVIQFHYRLPNQVYLGRICAGTSCYRKYHIGLPVSGKSTAPGVPFMRGGEALLWLSQTEPTAEFAGAGRERNKHELIISINSSFDFNPTTVSESEPFL